MRSPSLDGEYHHKATVQKAVSKEAWSFLGIDLCRLKGQLKTDELLLEIR